MVPYRAWQLPAPEPDIHPTPPWLVFYPGPGLYSLPNGTGVSGYAMEEGVHSALGAPRTVTGIGDLAGTP